MFYKREKDIPAIRVGIATGLKEFTFRCGGKFTMAGTGQYFKGEKDKFYSLVLKNGKLYLKDAKKGATYKKFKSPLTIKSNGYPFYILNITYGHGNFWHNEFDHIYRGDLKIISSKTISLINILSIEEYLYGVLPSEINASADPQALKAQAVAARTIALYSIKSSQRHRNEGFDVCADTHCQVYQGMSVEKSRTNKAVDETKGEIIVYRGEPIEAIYHSNCGGCLRPDVFYGKPYYALAFDSKKKFYQLSPYEEEMWFVSWPQSFCSHSQTSSYRWQRVYDSQDFSLAFGRDIKEIKAIRPKEKISGMAYKTLELIDKSGSHDIKGDFNIRNYFDKLRSSSFKVDIKFSNIPAAKNAKEVKKETRMIFFWGAGFGHGVGMCQDGTEYMAKDGYTYHEILSHYYPHTATIRQY
jgi:SpoIID/LytB domain protein